MTLPEAALPVTVHGWMLCDDLIFFSRVAGTARAAGLVVRQARSATELQNAVHGSQPSGVLIDLNAEGLDLPAVLAALREACATMPRVVGFGSHVQAEVLRAARLAGCDTVLPRSAFVQQLERELPGWLAPPPQG